MLKFGKVAGLPVMLSVAMAAAAGAQGSAQDCNVDENTTVAMSVFALMAAQQPGTAPAEIKKQLVTAIGRMFPDDATAERDNKRNPVGRAFVLGKIYMMYLSQEGQPVITTRGALGFKTNPTGVADLSVGIDSAFKIVEAQAPQCAYTTSQWRQQAGWVKLVQQAMDYANGGNVDSADFIAKEALRISPNAPYSHLVLGNVAAARFKNADAIQAYKDALDEASKDTIFNEVRRTILYTLGNFALDAGSADTVASNKATYLGEARSSFEALSKDPGKQYADVADQGLMQAYLATDDTAAVKSHCKARVDDPSNFGFLPLVRCGTALAQVRDFASASKVFDAATKQNPYHRDGLYNLGLMQITIGEDMQARAATKKDSSAQLEVGALAQFQAAIQTTDNLLKIDPSNPDNYRLYVHAYNGIRKVQLAKAKAFGDTVNALAASKKPADIAHRKALIDSAAKMDPLQRASLNKVVELNTKADSMPAKVTFTEFTPGPAKATLSGDIANRTDTEQSYILNVEFLDKTGQVVSTAKATVPKVRPKSRGNFSVTGTAPGIVAFRYAPVG